MREVQDFIEQTNDSVNFPNATKDSEAMKIREGNQKKLIAKLPSAIVPEDVRACIMRPLPPRQQVITREQDNLPASKKQKSSRWLQQQHDGAGSSTDGPFDAIDECIYERLRKDAVQAGKPSN